MLANSNGLSRLQWFNERVITLFLTELEAYISNIPGCRPVYSSESAKVQLQLIQYNISTSLRPINAYFEQWNCPSHVSIRRGGRTLTSAHFASRNWGSCSHSILGQDPILPKFREAGRFLRPTTVYVPHFAPHCRWWIALRKRHTIFFHSSVEEFLTSACLYEETDKVLRRHHVSMTPAHTLACSTSLFGHSAPLRQGFHHPQQSVRFLSH